MMYALDCRTVFLHVSQAMPGHVRYTQILKLRHYYGSHLPISSLLIPASTPVSITTEATTITTSTATTITTTTMSIFSDILPTIVIPLAIGAFSYVSSWWYREAGHFEPDTCFELSSFPVREVDERIRDLPMRSEMQAHSHRAMVNVPSPVCNKLSTAKMQPARSGFGLNHHLVSRLARESPQMGGGRQVPGPNPFLASTRQRISAPKYSHLIDIDLDVPIRRAVVYLPPPAVHSLPPPALPPPAPPTWTPEILAPTVVEPVEPMSPARPSKIRRIQEMSNLGCVMKWGSGGGFARKLCEIRKLAKIRRSRRVKFGGPPATPRRGAAMRMPLRDYTRGNQIRPDLLLTPSDIPYIGPLTSFWDAPMVAMGISPAPEVYGDVSSYIVTTPCPDQNEPCQDMDISPVRFETGQTNPNTVSSPISFWNSVSDDMNMDVEPLHTENEPQYVSEMGWGLSDPKEPTSPMGLSSPSRENGRESPLAPSSDLPRQSISVEKLYSLWADPEEELYDPSCLTSDELEYLWGDSKGKPYDPSCLPDGEETPYDPSCLPDGEFKNLWGDSEKELEYLWGGSDGSVGGSGESTSGIPENTTPSPTSKSSAFKEYGFSPKNHASSRNIAVGGVKWAETTTDMPRQSVSSVEMDCSWADSVENRSRITPPNPFAISESSTW
ncbi:hypothetical protein BASA50_004932 [Batrachochytrium salamandrivorans]|uniref:Uncharacterized protein n=1 Tax=Batrachochytrium salamandrivorans TaxID=1357716 RepID=A0ABQ8FE68_9FUNG|nr:hypothetical protein BASA50_004932 [Batrachochytrium salamandrivorans]